MEFVDPNISRKNRFQDEHLTKFGALPDGSPVFSEVEFNITGLCNRKCVFCPRVDPEIFPNVNEHLSAQLYQKTLWELREIRYAGRISFAGFGEPLLHPNLNELIHLTQETLPYCTTEIITNGDKLNPELLRQLFDSGLTTLLISMYDGPDQIEYFNNMTLSSGVGGDRVILRERYLSEENGYGINLSNRGGLLTFGDPKPDWPLQHPCFYTHYRMMVDYTGEVLLCPHDWAKKVIVGDLNSEHIVELWSGKVLTFMRNTLGAGNRNNPACRNCDVLGTRQGQSHFNSWQAFYNNR